MPSKTFLHCYSAMFDLGYCSGEILRAGRGQFSSSMRPTCCKAAKRISSACWLILFPFNPFLHQLSCSPLSMLPPPPVTNKPISDSQAPVARGPVALPPQAPVARGPVALPPQAPVARGPVALPPQAPVARGPVALPPQAPVARGPVALPPQSPDARGPVALPPSAQTPMVQGSFANSPNDKEAIE
ncbi:prolamin-like domain-containing protein [Artemisia annua]|uniref:Prolamin-like domain-containing protein n=1 Tax=Artemisia annua TaxID=35608 RepID=A0A2U1Q0E7_ARTAN|nr:prolamin-like domain-containing protein [Artemisia annua]